MYGGSGRGDPNTQHLALQPGPTGGSLPHPYRLLLPRQRRPTDRRLLLRRRGAEGGAGQGSGAVLPPGRPARAGPSRQDRDPVHRGGRPLHGRPVRLRHGRRPLRLRSFGYDKADAGAIRRARQRSLPPCHGSGDLSPFIFLSLFLSIVRHVHGIG